jgi:tripeptide aminopeptidase
MEMDRDRLAQTFTWLVGIDSVSREEGRLLAALRPKLESLGAEITVDDAAGKLGGDAGNLIARLPGNRDAAPLLLNAHMDTVEPGRGIQPVFKDGVFTSVGDTILGADDKSAIAILLETLRTVRERGLPHGPIDLVLTVCEEVGLQGAKHLDPGLLRARFGYALDHTDTSGIVTRAPGANRFEIRVVGRAAHAGAAPEDGINAILVAGKALSRLTLGRIDSETTCNVGTVSGGTATNIVPDEVVLKGEVRSHNPERLERVTAYILDAFRSAAEEDRREGDSLPRVEVDLKSDFRSIHIPDDHPVVSLAQKAAGNLGREMAPKRTGGGADANIFFEKGIVVGVLGTGMRDMHTVSESILLEDMAAMVELMIEILGCQAAGHLDKFAADG